MQVYFQINMGKKIGTQAGVHLECYYDKILDIYTFASIYYFFFDIFTHYRSFLDTCILPNFNLL